MTSRKILAASPTAIVLGDGDRIEAGGVIDARGPGDLSLLDNGWQKFVGREYALARAARPVAADDHGRDGAAIDGYRFVYTLPFAATRMFVEDTYYSDTPVLDRVAIGARCDAYAAAHGWQAERVVREETGVLPVTMGGDFEAYWRSGRQQGGEGGHARGAVSARHRLFAARRDPRRGAGGGSKRPVRRGAARPDAWFRTAKLAATRLLSHAQQDAVPRRRTRWNDTA